MAETPLTNGSGSPRTPRLSSLAMTEYSAYPSPPNERQGLPPDWEIPEAFLLPNGYPDYLRLILTSRVYDVVKETPLTHAVNMSNRLRRTAPVFVCCFHVFPTHFDDLGNHAQGVAYSARTLKIPATIVMPSGTPAIKHRNVARLGGTVVLHGRDFDAAKQEAARLSKLHDLTNIPPFDDPYVIAGQGTCGMELLRQSNIQNLEAVFCCVGGGGLIAGIGVYIKRIAPHVKLIGVETHDANAMAESLANGERVTLNEVGLFADGAAVRAVGEETFRLCREVVDDIIQVSTDEACAAIKDIFEDTRSVVEPAGALSLAGLKKYVAMNPSPNPNRELVAVTSGANMNFDRLRFVAERATLGERKEALLSVTIPERPGSFAKLLEILTPHDVTEFSYRFSGSEYAVVLMGISLATSTGTEDLSVIVNQLLKNGMRAYDLSDDELAKTHIRYLAGGRNNVEDERLFMFEFPERPGALAKFLTTLRPHQNISLFHYRNYGSDVAKVLAGIQCPVTEKAELEGFLHDLGYPVTECTDSPVYEMFLRE
ncbi:threonine dehydratase, mitochondrial precursor [Histoplasma mississippiense (nom. inval.)]|uniref:threonine dehydratase, mitochondrial precursor n=1 Tax=Ajellomyces capsulatus (strain NAm1 / WU24) TaxID=2059318 RepID=UPI000157CE5C|nr:threonine dehydratase, mitochondrial precursor [Histoplasma mississippiense (nom. inval.)]EDN10450.1 threonine dehydratase, mitochondrial precursor [Histoplasma mississippiense (nom. inval.)]